jgi:hypothetical protein
MLGTLLATAAATGVATSQTFSTVDNDQTSSGDVLADGDLDVVDVDTVDQTVNAMGNGYTSDVETGFVTVTSAQETTGNVQSTNRVGVSDYAYRIDQNTTATGNSGEANSLGYGDQDLTAYQRLGPANVTAANTLDAPTAQIDNLNANAQAIGNSHAFSQVGASGLVVVDQENEGLVQADGAYQFRYSTGAATTTASAIANNVTGAGVEGATQDITVNQTMNGQRTQASQYVAAANAQEINAASTAVANNVAISNGDNPLKVTARQTNNAFVMGESNAYAYDFGAATAQSTAVANSSVVGQFGPEITVDVEQINSSGVQSTAEFSGGRGYDAYSSATAIGNASTAYACTTCGEAKMTINNYQSNSGQVRSSGSVTVSGENRHVSSVSTAVGNSATYYVSAGQ